MEADKEFAEKIRSQVAELNATVAAAKKVNVECLMVAVGDVVEIASLRLITGTKK